MKKVIQLLTECLLFKDMSLADKTNCLQQFNYQIKKYKKGEVIVYAQDQVIQQLILLNGKIKNEMSDFNGKTIKITDMVSPKILAPGFIFGNVNHYPVSIFAKSECEIMVISKEFFISTLLNNRQLQLNFFIIISNQTQFLTRKINFLSLKTLKSKIAFFLLNKFKQQKKSTIILPQSQTQMADLFGVTRPSLSRSLNDMVHDSIIKIEGRKIMILNLEELKSYLL